MSSSQSVKSTSETATVPSKMASKLAMSRGWQRTRTLTECHKYMLENQVACDLTINFTKETGSQPQRAHKYIMVCRSPVFEAMFSGGFQESDNLIIEDVEPDVFMQILRYMYCDEADISGHNVLHVMYAAKKYLLDGLVKRCSEFLEREISEENVCSILNHCLLYDEKALTDKSLAFIADHAKSVFDSEDFLNVSQETLHQILSVSCTPGPVDTFNSCVRWSEHRQASGHDGTLRDIIGKCLYEIPFVQMETKELAVCMRHVPGLLTDTEQAELFKYITDHAPSGKAEVLALGFSELSMKPKPVKEVLASDNRFTSINLLFRASNKSYPETINFQVSSSVMFHGLTLYGGQQKGVTRDVHLELLEGTKTLCTHDCTVVSTGTSKPIRVTVPEPVIIRPGVMYTIKSGIDGQLKFHGNGGKSRVTTAGCTFTFHDTLVNICSTSIDYGQIPQILFSKRQYYT